MSLLFWVLWLLWLRLAFELLSLAASNIMGELYELILEFCFENLFSGHLQHFPGAGRFSRSYTALMYCSVDLVSEGFSRMLLLF